VLFVIEVIEVKNTYAKGWLGFVLAPTDIKGIGFNERRGN
jgi:hypothetical protein